MMDVVVIDTNAYSALQQGDKTVEQLLNQAKHVILPIFVLAELLYGFKNGNRELQNRIILGRFESKPQVTRFFPTNRTIEIFSDVLTELKQKGRVIPIHDIWIAACAIELDAPLLSYDQHFQFIDQIQTLPN